MAFRNRRYVNLKNKSAMMKRLFYLVLSLTVLAGCNKNGCDPVDPEEEVLMLDKHRFEVSADGEMISVQVTSNVNYAVTIPDAFRSWLSEEASKVSKTHIFAVSANEESEVRKGYVLFSGTLLTDTVWVEQAPTMKLSNIPFDMVYVKGGTFQMGATSEQGDDYDSDEKPVHEVTLSDYYIGKYEVTQGFWKAVMGNNPSYFKAGDNYPVENVSWNDVQEFIAKLNELTGRKFALPTEAQWEYAARGGVKTQGYKYSGSNDIDEVAWYDNSENSTHPVGAKKANELGIYDMSGNVYEWCQDWYDDYDSEAQTNPTGPETGSKRVVRGASWYNSAGTCRVSFRGSDYPSDRSSDIGFRLVFLP